MPTCAEVLAATLRDAGVERMYGLPGGEILDFIEAARRVGIEFILVRHEAVAAFMADASGQIERKPGVCVSTLGPGALNLTLGVANAYLDRSPLIAITATMATSAAPYATHQQLDLNAVFRPFTKDTVTLDGVNTAATVRRLWRTALEPRFGPVHIALPSDVAKREERQADAASVSPPAIATPTAKPDAIDRMAREIAHAERPVLILGLDLNPYVDAPAVRRFAEAVGAPVFVTPKAKGIFPEDHPQFFGICSGLAADSVIVSFLERADLLIGVGFDPVESDKTWHETMKLVSIAPVTIASGAFRPPLELCGDVTYSLSQLAERTYGPFAWTGEDERAFRETLEQMLVPGYRQAPGPLVPGGSQAPCQAVARHRVTGLSPVAVTRRLRELYPPETIVTTDVGSIKLIVSQAWRSTVPMTFLESNGLSAMGYGLPAAMAAKLARPDRPVLCTVGDGGFSMVFADLETCVRRRIPFVTVVYNDCALSLIEAAQERRGYENYGVRYGAVDFATAAAALGAWSHRAETLDELAAAVKEAQRVDGPAVIEVPIDPSEYRSHIAPVTQK
jgi:acetolactate synthase I/II/III large subunit